MNKKGDLFYTFLHLPFDLLAIWLAFLSAYYLRGNGLEIYKLPISDYIPLMYVAVPLWIAVYAIQGLYSRMHLFGTLQNLSQISVASLAGWASFVVYLVFSKTEATLVFPRLMLLYILILSIVYVFVGRLFLRFVQYCIRSLGYGRSRVAILGSGKLAQEMEQSLKASHDTSMTFVGLIEPSTPEEVAEQLTRKRVHQVIVADNTLNNGKAFEYLIAIQGTGAVCHFVPNMFDVQVSNVLFETLAGMPMLTFRQTPLEGWGRIAKRLFDIVMSIIGLIVLSPVYLLTMLLVKLTSPGPVIFYQRRLGRNGSHFNMYKFRSMFVHLTGDHVKGKTEEQIFAEMGRDDLVAEYKRDRKVKVDPRVTPLGRIMRKTRLDELPQLWNVLKGDLSIVGPRPIRDFELELYGRWASYLLSIKPGLTGLWQVSGASDISYDERVKLDAHYVQNWTLWHDMVIIIKTVLTILGGSKGAY